MFSFAVFALCFICPATDAQQIKNAIPEVARPLPLAAVRLTGGPLKHAQDLDIDYLLKLEPDRMMAGYRIRAACRGRGLRRLDSPNGNNSPATRQHYGLPSLMRGYGRRAIQRTRRLLVKEMKEVQDKRANGYLGAITDIKSTEGKVISRKSPRETFVRALI
jgi:hypothetical protein